MWSCGRSGHVSSTGAGGENGIAKMWNRREIPVSSYDDQSHDLHPNPYSPSPVVTYMLANTVSAAAAPVRLLWRWGWCGVCALYIHECIPSGDSHEVLVQAGHTPTTLQMFEGLEHSVRDDEMAVVVEWLRMRLPPVE
jgi:hypothetical protein